MAIISMREILSESVDRRYAVGAFDTLNYSMTEAVVGAAEAKDRPIILMVLEQFFKTEGCELFFHYLVRRCEISSVPVALHLDHGSSFESVVKAIRYGCSSVMMDASMYPMDENIAITRRVVEVAHACGVSVEAEIGHVSGHEGDMLEGNVAEKSGYTRVEDAVRFVEETGVDALAVAFGTVHGVFKGEPQLDFNLLEKIRAAVPLPLVMHGGSGLSVDDFKKSIQLGINKINFFTGMSLAGAQAIGDFIEKSQKKHHFHELLKVGMDRISEVVREQIEIFGTHKLKGF